MPEQPGGVDGPLTEAGASQPDDPRITAALGLLRVLCGALAASVLVYAGVAWFITEGAAGGSEEPVGLPVAIVAVLAALAVFDLVIAPVVERALADGVGGGGTGEDVGKPSQDVAAAVATYRRGKLVGFAFREAAAILGLLISLFTGNPSWCYALVAATLVAMALAWPSREGLVRAVRGSVQPG